ncbi:MAG: aldolase catalytic domain-containing protein [Candidatus Omnitrophica bacterium]|nr:aldolase catalytic domain-containing protein [Candidatus Omnitrophota bacterium]MCA9417252.1 aldolase catalytic domain-containing protein [Candidatus Omnitrophota bacterium]
MGPEKKEAKKGKWVAYRPEVKVLDCTIRDGGLINNHQFTDEFVRAVYEANVAAGVDYMEFGYKGSKRIFDSKEFGDWKFCDEDAIRRIVGDNPAEMKLSVMADAERCDYKDDILPKSESVIDMIRVACYIHQIPIAIEMVEDANTKGYETCCNIMAASTVHENDLREGLEALADSPVDVVYLVDSFGSFYSEEIRELTKRYLKILSAKGKEVGIHMHNNQQLGFANTIEGMISGANYLDATINGMGRGAGNCPLELLLGFLHNPKFNVRPLLKCIQEQCLPLQSEMEWGYQLPYMVTGLLNQHPRTAIKMRAGESPDDYVGFWDQMVGSD